MQAALLSLYFQEPQGINYRAFLSRIHPQQPLEDLYVSTRRTRAFAEHNLTERAEMKPSVELDAVLEKIAAQVWA